MGVCGGRFLASVCVYGVCVWWSPFDVKNEREVIRREGDRVSALRCLRPWSASLVKSRALQRGGLWGTQGEEAVVGLEEGLGERICHREECRGHK